MRSVRTLASEITNTGYTLSKLLGDEPAFRVRAVFSLCLPASANSYTPLNL